MSMRTRRSVATCAKERRTVLCSAMLGYARLCLARLDWALLSSPLLYFPLLSSALLSSPLLYFPLPSSALFLSSALLYFPLLSSLILFCPISCARGSQAGVSTRLNRSTSTRQHGGQRGRWGIDRRRRRK